MVSGYEDKTMDYTLKEFKAVLQRHTNGVLCLVEWPDGRLAFLFLWYHY